ncbi:RNA-splicing factor [Monascus purpureus]|uniref:RNA-splicing factor n=1 Tax=Monascus purpureus TaxID=5098 RepID=A0A507QR38_MONPU|nr:RNA-splicing factor [Monascus purpureus]BDD58173.1 hypothetical protein MAP00_003473 [Monascus purpureus]
MGGDLNLKKSWHPSLLRNQERVWAEEKRALEERKRIDQLRRERDEERQIQELQRLQEASGKPKQHQRVDWMYQAPSSATGHYSEEMEGYLLGKRRIDSILLKNEESSKKLEKGVDAVTTAAQTGGGAVLSARDTMTKVRSDPLLEVKKREQAAYEAALQMSIRRQQRAERREKKERSRQSTHERRGRDEEEDSHRRHRRHHRHRSRSRSPVSPDRESRRRRRNDSRDDWHRREDRDYRRHRDDRDRRDDRYRHNRDRGERGHRDDRDYHHSSKYSDRDVRDRSRSGRRDSYHRRSPSASSSASYERVRPSSRRSSGENPPSKPSYDTKNHSNGEQNYTRKDTRPRHGDYKRQPFHRGSDRSNDEAKKAQLEEERKRKLAEMQSNAEEMEDTRRQRVKDITAIEEQQRLEEDKHRSDRGRFVSQLHRRAQEDSLDERIRRSRGGLAKLDED